MEIFRTLVPTSANVELARSLCSSLAGDNGDNMFTTPLVNASGIVTHYISSGYISDSFAMALSDPNVLFYACQQAGLSTTLAQCKSLLGTGDISADEPDVVMMRLGVSIKN